MAVVLLFIVALFIIWGVIAFVSLEPMMYRWTEHTRVVYLILSIALTTALTGIVANERGGTTDESI